MADDDIIRGGLDIVTDKKKNNKPKAEQETAQPTAAWFKNVLFARGYDVISMGFVGSLMALTHSLDSD